jgi:hypothetical protein
MCKFCIEATKHAGKLRLRRPCWRARYANRSKKKK